ncbi:MAG TPA: hypothetical protein VE422_30925 [Terriglobia bacterium]|nr:hypothetical protein [Terriglobia bacterium]
MNTEEIDGQQLGEAGLDQLTEVVFEACKQEKRRRTLVNAQALLPLRAKFHVLKDRHAEIVWQLRRSDVALKLQVPWIRGCNALIVIALFLAGLFLCHATLVQLGLANEAWWVSIGAALVACLSTEKLIDAYHCDGLVKVLSAVAFACSLAGLVILAIIRGHQFAAYLRQMLDPDPASQLAAGENFYTSTIMLLQLFTAMLSLATELTAGLALHELFAASSLAFAGKTLSEELLKVRSDMIEIVGQIQAIQNEPEAFEATFKRDFAVALVRRTKRADLLRWLGLPVVTALVMAGGSAYARSHNAVVVLSDLTISVAEKGYDGRSESDNNWLAITDLIKVLPEHTTVTVVGISDQSFARPYVLLRGDIPVRNETLPLVNPTQIAKQRILRQIQDQRQQFTPRFKDTDLFGAIKYAGEILRDAPPGSTKSLVILSDMRNSTEPVNLEAQRRIQVGKTLADLARLKMLIPLQGVQVFVIGADANGKSTTYWDSLRDFWTEYFQRTGANLHTFAATREVPHVGPSQ